MRAKTRQKRITGSYRGKKNSKKLKNRVIIAGICILTLLLSYYMLAKMKPLIQTISANQAKLLCTSTINKTIAKQIKLIETDYNDLVSYVMDEDGKIVAIESNAIEMNRIKTQLTDAVNDELGRLPDQKITIPLGTFTGIELLSGRGPNISMIVTPSSYIESELIHCFDSAGINQTRHQITIYFKATMFAILAPYTTQVEVNTSIVIAETIIVGVVPETYANIQ